MGATADRILRLWDAMISTLSRIDWLPPLFMRLSLGFVFAQSGWGKLHSIDQVVSFFESLKIPFASIQAPFVATIELVAGILIAAGLATRLASLLMMGVMAVAIATALWPDLESWTDVLGLSEMAYFLVFFWLFVHGAGRASVDYWTRY